jgi:hypothetical protein
MGEIHRVSRERHGRSGWNRTAGFGWAQKEQVVAIALQETPQLMLSLPLGFVRYEDQTLFVALLGVRPAENLFVAPDGRWLAPHVPVIFQHYPFKRMRDTEGREILGVDEAGILAADAPGATRFYDDNGKPAADLANILQQLVQGDSERHQAGQIASLLDQHGLLEPWELRTQDDAGAVIKVEGMLRVNENKLNEVPADLLREMRDTRSLLMAYCQLLSMQHIQHLGRLAHAHAAVRQRTQSQLDHGNISFDNL